MTLKVWVSEGNQMWLLAKSAEGKMKVPELILRCLLKFFSTGSKTLVVLDKPLPEFRPHRITVGFSKDQWEKLITSAKDLELRKTQLVYNVVRNYHQEVIDEELNHLDAIFNSGPEAVAM